MILFTGQSANHPLMLEGNSSAEDMHRREESTIKLLECIIHLHALTTFGLKLQPTTRRDTLCIVVGLVPTSQRKAD